MLKGIGNIAQMLKQAQQMGSRMNELNAELKSKRVTGTAGGGLVEVEANGIKEIIRVKIDRTLAEEVDLEMIEELIPAAVNMALHKANQLHLESMKDLTGGMNLPGLDDALSQMTGADDSEEKE